MYKIPPGVSIESRPNDQHRAIYRHAEFGLCYGYGYSQEEAVNDLQNVIADLECEQSIRIRGV